MYINLTFIFQKVTTRVILKYHLKPVSNMPKAYENILITIREFLMTCWKKKKINQDLFLIRRNQGVCSLRLDMWLLGFLETQNILLDPSEILSSNHKFSSRFEYRVSQSLLDQSSWNLNSFAKCRY